MYESAEYSEADKEEGEGEVVIILGDGGGVWDVGIRTWLCFEHMYCRCRNYKNRNRRSSAVDIASLLSQHMGMKRNRSSSAWVPRP